MCVSIFIYPTMLLPSLSRFFSFFSDIFSSEPDKPLVIVIVIFLFCFHIHRTHEKRQRTQGYSIEMEMSPHFLSLSVFSSSFSIQQQDIVKRTEFILIIITRSSLFLFSSLHNCKNGREQQWYFLAYSHHCLDHCP